MDRFCRVALDSPVLALDRPFDYAIPDRLAGKVRVGSVVRVVLHGRNMRAFVTELLSEASVPDPRPLRSVVASEPVFAARELALARWTADRYVTSLGRVLHDAVPGRFSAPSAAGDQAPDSPARDAPSGAFAAGIADVIARSSVACVFPPTVAREVDIAAAAAAHDGQTLVICPRVELAESVAEQISGALVLHGSERPADRARAWAAARDERARVIVGGRSALLVPMPSLRAVCVLSTHDRSLKSERSPRLHASVVARKRAALCAAAFIGSSPAPPVELAAEEATAWVVGERSGVRAEVARPRGGPVTPRLIEMVRWSIGEGRDALVFVGRRGSVLRLRCKDCGWTPTCSRCGSGLAPASERGRLACRVCDKGSAAPSTCSSCGGALAEGGWGHERVASELDRADLGAPVLRAVRGSLPQRTTSPAVVVGTLAAAHASAVFGCICVADLDQLLARPDFRAGERALQTLHELAGVLDEGGRFLVQTRESDHHAVQSFVRGSYRYFFDREMVFRKETGYPPYGAVVRVDTTQDGLEQLRGAADEGGGVVIGGVERRGTVSALVRGPRLDALVGPLRAFAAANPRARIDVDPVDVV